MEENTVKTKKKSRRNWYILILVVGIILLVVFIIWLLMKGEVKTTGNYPDDVTPETLKCVGKNIPYFIYKKTDSPNTEIDINAIFTGGKINSISLVHRSKHNDADAADMAMRKITGDMNYSFADSGLKQFALNATYTVDDKVAQMALYATSNDLDDKSIKYFMLDNLPENLTGYKRGYISQGFTCEVTR